jgi:hypothetical protein
MSTTRTAPVFAYSPDTKSAYAVIQQREGQKPLALLASLDEPFTLARCQQIFAQAQLLDTRNITRISIEDPDRNREYKYSATHNRLTIWQNDVPIYENWDGNITRDCSTLEDCLM